MCSRRWHGLPETFGLSDLTSAFAGMHCMVSSKVVRMNESSQVQTLTKTHYSVPCKQPKWKAWRQTTI